MSKMLPHGVRPLQGTRVSQKLSQDEIVTLQEVCAWWRERNQGPQGESLTGARRPRHVTVFDELWEQVSARADEKGVSVGGIVNLALEPHTHDAV